MNTRRARRALPVIALLFVAAGCTVWRLGTHRDIEPGPGPYPVVKVVDGDTLEVQIGRKVQRVRLIGVDTPETVHPNKPVEPFGPEASEFLKKTLTGQEVVLAYNHGRVRYDKYKRLLAYVRRSSDNLDVNREVIIAGYGRAEPQYSHERKDEFLKAEAEAEAKREKRGLWSLQSGKEPK